MMHILLMIPAVVLVIAAVLVSALFATPLVFAIFGKWCDRIDRWWPGIKC